MIKWYHLEAPVRIAILRCFYAAAFFGYPIFVLINIDKYIPKRRELLGVRLSDSEEAIDKPKNSIAR
ncbi:hypothetical protein AB6A40_006230 [Gnathostoma spinigerum]|uniref:Uncharacterized protein n=1 Tax=Gnathostoma spinigerum TaxID=75299 RepID=A0ABD6EIF1_9BILA